MTPDDWRFVNTFAPWASAIGTVAAVVVALLIARRRTLVSLKIYTTRHEQRSPLYPSSPAPVWFMLQAVNHGEAEAHAGLIIWSAGWLGKKQVIHEPQTYLELRGIQHDELPKVLKFGERVTIALPLAGPPDWTGKIAAALIAGQPWWKRWPLRIGIGTSTGDTFFVSVPDFVREELYRRARELGSAPRS
jgi:hypothetical protein